MNKPIYYTALFVKDQEALFAVFPPKHSNKVGHHCTLEFKPVDLQGVEVGKTHRLKVLSRIYDDKGDALLVECSKSRNKYPHITLSHADEVDRSYSNTMIEKRASEGGQVEYLDKDVFIEVVEGYHDGEKVLIS